MSARNVGASSVISSDVEQEEVLEASACVRDELFFKAYIHPHSEHSQRREISTSKRINTTLRDTLKGYLLDLLGCLSSQLQSYKLRNKPGASPNAGQLPLLTMTMFVRI
ncbi:hypothetical protein Q7C36_003509 [Tachysurus vachellii]|uniref:Uncharacterized protein n=1 Tax=Tachysurus vachellii TaxID=175792 RepID=A0AA88NUJ4_TACVA|nr:hypothetical protein Q7C36_003509 [Tachysurus vachellii]